MIGIGQVVSGKYRLLRLLGDGGMGSVYEAQHEGLGTRVAIKVLHADLARRGGLIERFLQEARVAAQIRSPHVVQVTDVERTEDGNAYIVMELLQGEPLSTVLERERKVPIPTAVDYTHQILEALEAAHALGVTHRDLKPENVFVTFVGGKPVIKLIDFGIAKLRTTDPAAKNLTVAGVVMGTAEYMAPEQAYSADKADARSDIYAVGVMLYEMIAGTRPVDGDDARIIAARVERGDVKPLIHVAPQAPRELAGFVHRAMAARAELRFATATEMRVALEKVSLSPDKGRVTTRPLDAIGKDATHPAGPPAMELGPSTMLGAPAEAAFAAHATGAHPTGHGAHAAHDDGARGRVPAGATATPAVPLVAPSHAPPPAHAYEAPLPTPSPLRRKKRSSMWIALFLLPLLLGVGVVVALVINAQQDSGGAATATATTPVTTTPTATETQAVATTTTTAPVDTGTVAPLKPGTPVRPPTNGKPPSNGTAVKTDGGPAGSASSQTPTSTAPFPSIPPLPSNFPIPSGFPSSFPTSFPFPGTTAAPSSS